MNVFGMGPLEILIILLIAFIFLGPERMVDAGRWIGKAAAQLRRLSAGLPDMVIGEEPDGAPTGRTRRRHSQRGDRRSPSITLLLLRHPRHHRRRGLLPRTAGRDGPYTVLTTPTTRPRTATLSAGIMMGSMVALAG